MSDYVHWIRRCLVLLVVTQAVTLNTGCASLAAGAVGGAVGAAVVNEIDEDDDD